MVKPADIFEEIWVRDIVEEALRVRRQKANPMTATAYRGLEQILKPLVGFLEEEKLAKARPQGLLLDGCSIYCL